MLRNTAPPYPTFRPSGTHANYITTFSLFLLSVPKKNARATARAIMLLFITSNLKCNFYTRTSTNSKCFVFHYLFLLILFLCKRKIPYLSMVSCQKATVRRCKNRTVQIFSEQDLTALKEQQSVIRCSLQDGKFHFC